MANRASGMEPRGPDQDEPVRLEADQVVHDRDLGIVTAKGRVEIVQSGRSVFADTVSYNLKQDVVSASGNVALLEPSGDVMFADYFELTDDMKEGVAKQLRMILADNSRLSGTNAQRMGGNRTDLTDGVYTACEPCRKNPSRPPLWAVKAKEATHDQTNHEVVYRDAWVEMGGVPIAYTPYMSHPDPTVKRKSGLLVPTISSNSTLGTGVTVPYFWAINNSQDITFTPRFLFPQSSGTDIPDDTDGVLRRVVLSGEHRWQGMTGATRTKASLTADKDTGDLRGHIDAEGLFDISSVWRAGYQIQRASDDTYNQLYSFNMNNDRPWLTTRPYAEAFGARSYGVVEAYAFQGLQSDDDPGESPVVLPHVHYSHMGFPTSSGGYWTMDSDVLSYARSEGTDASRMSQEVAYHRPFTGRMGDTTTLTTSLRGDAYHADHLSSGGSANSGRAVPQMAADWRMPFNRPSKTVPQVIEPIVMVAASPNGGNPSKIPNEDSIDFELDETNILRANRMPGLDKVEGGLRGGYGVRWAAYPNPGGYVVAQAAQGWRAHADSTYSEASGFSDNLSDYVGRLDIAPSSYFALLNRIRLDKDNLRLRRNENTVTMGTPLFRPSVTYLMFERGGTDDELTFERRHSITYSISSDISRYWSLTASAENDLTEGGGAVYWSGKVAYSDECFDVITSLRRHYTSNGDYEEGYDLTLNVVFKTLGSIPVGLF